MQVGEQIQVRAYKSDGACYRWWQATVEAVEAEQLVLVTPSGHWIGDIDGGWVSRWAIRSYYWPNRSYSLLEVYTADGRLYEVYVNINSPVEIEDSQIRFTDYELDVSRKPPHQACIVDEDEFWEAVSRFGYSKEFQQTCYQVAREAMELANHWIAKGMPVIEALESRASSRGVETTDESL